MRAPPEFLARDPQAITAELVADFQRLTGKTLYPAQIEQLYLDFLAYRETLARNAFQEGALQMLPRFARAPILDYLGEFWGVVRLPARPATVSLRFTVPAASPLGRGIPAGTRVQSGDGRAVFATAQAASLPAFAVSVDVVAECTEAGTAGNGWQAGQLNVLVDALGLAGLTVGNTAVSLGGVAEEDDEHLRARVLLAPEAKSRGATAGYYRYEALSADSRVLDAAVISPSPRVVNVYPLTASGAPDAGLLAVVHAHVTADAVKGLTDQVQALIPAAVDYAITATLTPRAGQDGPALLAAAQAAAQAFAAERAAGFGRDVVPELLVAALAVPGLYRVQQTGLADVLAVGATQWARCTGISLSLVVAVHG